MDMQYHIHLQLQFCISL